MKINEVFILEERGVLYINGEDKDTFLQNLISNDIKKVSRKTAQELENLAESNSTDLTKKHLKETVKNLDNQKPFQAMDASYSGMQSMQSIESSMNQISSNFQKQASREMAKKFRFILRDLLSISKSQELLRAEAENIPSNSPRKNDLASKQQLLQDQLVKTMKKPWIFQKKRFLLHQIWDNHLAKQTPK